jgi:hypothetical protein
MDRPEAISATPDGLRVAIRLAPRAGRTAIAPEVADGPGGPAFRAQVTAAPSGGAANAALVALLAKTWHLPKSAIEIAAGAKDRNKTVLLRGDPAALRAGIARWMQGES